MKKLRNKKILVLGQRWVKPVHSRYAIGLEREGVKSAFFVTEPDRGVNGNEITIYHAPQNRFLRFVEFVKIIRKYKPDHVELYMHSSFFLLLAYTIVIKLINTPLVTWCTGGEIAYFEERNHWRKIITRFVLDKADSLIVKEPYMPSAIEKHKLAPKEKLFNLPNKIPIQKDYKVERKKHQVLFLNSFKAWRHPELIIEAAPIVRERISDVNFVFAGARNEDEIKFIESEALKHQCSDIIKIIPFTSETSSLLDESSIFVLPADLIYLNNSLLESMERAIPPIVANVDPWVGEIIIHGHNGFILPKDSKVWAEIISKLLQDENYRITIGRAARKTIELKYDFNKGISELITFFEEKLWIDA